MLKHRFLLFITIIVAVIMVSLVGAKTATSSEYEVKRKIVEGKVEYRFLFNGFHFMTATDDSGAFIIRPHPGCDVNGWGSSWYAQSFLPGAILGYTTVDLDSFTVYSDRIQVSVQGAVSYGLSSSYGSWNIIIDFSYHSSEKTITGSGTYNILLDEVLTNITGDLNIYKIASNYLDDVPLLSDGIGDTGDMKQAVYVGDGFNFSWIPPHQPSHFPQGITKNLSIDVIGQYNNVDTEAQGYASIEPAYKPSLKVVLNSLRAGEKMIFGAMYDTIKSKNYWEDNVGITPLILYKYQEIPNTDKEFNFNITFESKALPEDDCTASTTTIVTTTTSTTTTTSPVTSTTTTIPSTTTIPKPSICAAEAIYGETSEQTELLRKYRDNVLSKTPGGQEIIKTYYKFSPTATKLLEQRPLLKDKAKSLIDSMLPGIRKKVEASAGHTRFLTR